MAAILKEEPVAVASAWWRYASALDPLSAEVCSMTAWDLYFVRHFAGRCIINVASVAVLVGIADRTATSFSYAL